MRFILLMASNDDVVKSNFQTLYGQRYATSSQTELPLKDVLTYDELTKKLHTSNQRIIDALKKPTLSSDAHQIEFLAHGNNHNPRLLYIEPRLAENSIRADATISEIKINETQPTSSNDATGDEKWKKIDPQIVANFFSGLKKSASNNYNFSNITLFCCRSNIFDQELSNLVKDINVTCFEDDINVFPDGNAYTTKNGRTVTADKFSYKNGDLVSKITGGKEYSLPNTDDHKISDEATANTLMAESTNNKPYILRGNPYKKHDPIPLRDIASQKLTSDTLTNSPKLTSEPENKLENPNKSDSENDESNSPKTPGRHL
jgi:hypothetical protein